MKVCQLEKEELAAILKEMVVSAVVEEGDKVPVVEGNSKVPTASVMFRNSSGRSRPS